MRSAIVLGSCVFAISVALLWQAQPSKRVLMTDDHPAVVDLGLPPNAPAVITGGAPVGASVNVTEVPFGAPIDETKAGGDSLNSSVPLPPPRPKSLDKKRAELEPMTAARADLDPRGPVTPDFERGVCFMYRVGFGIGYVTIGDKQYDCR